MAISLGSTDSVLLPSLPRACPAFLGWLHFHITHSVVSVTFQAHLLLARWPNDRPSLRDTRVNAQYRQHLPSISSSTSPPPCPPPRHQVTLTPISHVPPPRPHGPQGPSTGGGLPAGQPLALVISAGTLLSSEPPVERGPRSCGCPRGRNPKARGPPLRLGEPPREQPGPRSCQGPAQPAAHLLGGSSAQWAWRPCRFPGGCDGK